jgi:hypothetical protein
MIVRKLTIRVDKPMNGLAMREHNAHGRRTFPG